jgi:hypothetical protein
MDLQIIRAREFIRLGAHGHFDLVASKAALAKLAGACRKRGIDRALMDLRDLQPGAKPVFSPSDLVALVNTFREIGFTERQRLAVLYRTDPHRRARLFALISTLRGWSVRAFCDFEKAIFWLSSEVAENPQSPPATTAKMVPVRTIKPESSPASLPVRLIQSKPAGIVRPVRAARAKIAASRP